MILEERQRKHLGGMRFSQDESFRLTADPTRERCPVPQWLDCSRLSSIVCSEGRHGCVWERLWQLARRPLPASGSQFEHSCHHVFSFPLLLSAQSSVTCYPRLESFRFYIYESGVILFKLFALLFFFLSGPSSSVFQSSFATILFLS